MNELRKLFYLLLIIPIMFVNTGCSDDDNDGGTDPVVVNEAEVLVKYLEAEGGNPINNFAAMIPATTVNTNILTGADQVVIDIRSAEDYGKGHIQGAVNKTTSELLSYYESNNLEDKEVVVIACYSGQTAGWATGLMHTLGYTNVKDLAFGMCSWNSATNGSWPSNISNGKVASMVTAPTAKAEAGDLPLLETGFEAPQEILRARVEVVFAEGFSAATTKNDPLFDSPSSFYIVNYWSEDHYNLMHIPGAIQYTPKVDLAYTTYLTTLPTDKTVAVYCYTGQTSAHVAAYLRVLGYDAKTVLFGVNAMAHDTMPGTAFDTATHVNEFELVTP